MAAITYVDKTWVAKQFKGYEEHVAEVYLKKEDVSKLALLKFTGVVDTVDDLPTENVVVGTVYLVKDKSAEYVYVEAEVEDATVGSWEEFGPVNDTFEAETEDIDFSELFAEEPAEP